MELRHLRYFVATAEELNFHRAAERLHMSQPPLSQQIRILEEELGVQLFTRAGRQVALTDAGNVFLAHARRILQSTEVARNDARRAQEGVLGTLSIGFIGSVAYSILPWILSAFRARVPNVELGLRQLDIAQQIDALHGKSIDVGFLRPPVHDKKLSIRHVFSERYIVALHAAHPMATAKRIALRSLADQNFIMFPPNPGMMFYNQVHALCERAGFVPRIVQLAGPMQTVIGLVSAGIGIAIVPQSVRQLAMPDVVYVDLRDRHATSAIAMAWRSGDRSEILRVFVDIAARVVRQRSRSAA